MAAVIKCDACGNVVPVGKAKHVRVYPMATATTYTNADCKYYADVCIECEKKLKQLLNIGGRK